MDKISIIIPMYNAEKYIKRCLESIFEQTYKNIEIVIVDDGSTDNSYNICKKYEQQNKKIKLFHKKNNGVSSARNYGLKKCTGKYLCFVDSDDYIEKYYIQQLYKAIKDNNTKISQCAINIVDDNLKKINNKGYSHSFITNGKKLIIDTFNNEEIGNIVLWNKMYERSLFNNIQFPNGKNYEDEFITYKILYKENRISIIPDKLYNYRKHINSITNSKYTLKNLEGLEALIEKINFFKKNNEIFLYIMTINEFLEFTRQNYICLIKYVSNSTSYQKKLIQKYKEYYKIIQHNKQIPIKSKIKNIIFYINPKLYFLLKKNSIKKSNYT